MFYHPIPAVAEYGVRQKTSTGLPLWIVNLPACISAFRGVLPDYTSPVSEARRSLPSTPSR